MCSVAGDVVFMIAFGTGTIFWMCPGCGCAWDRIEATNQVESIDSAYDFAPHGFAPASGPHIEAAGLWNEIAVIYDPWGIYADPLFSGEAPTRFRSQ